MIVLWSVTRLGGIFLGCHRGFAAVAWMPGTEGKEGTGESEAHSTECEEAMLATQKLGLGTEIVRVLRQYGEVTLDFLSYRLNREISEIERYLKPMEDAGAVRRDGQKLALVTK